jgi:hypothetical protein
MSSWSCCVSCQGLQAAGSAKRFSTVVMFALQLGFERYMAGFGMTQIIALRLYVRTLSLVKLYSTVDLYEGSTGIGTAGQYL